MAKKVAIHQINYIPWLGYFNKIKSSDLFVFLDTVDYAKNDFLNRNKIRTHQGWCYLTIPIDRQFHRQKFSGVLLPNDDTWAQKHWKTIKISYEKAPYFKSYSRFIEECLKSPPARLSDFNLSLITKILKLLDITTETIKSSELEIDSGLTKTDLLLEILSQVGATKYLSGQGARDYLEEGKFTAIRLEFQEFKHPIYRQIHGEFIPFMSIIDLLFNEGEKSIDFI